MITSNKGCIDGGDHCFNPRYDRKFKDGMSIKLKGFRRLAKIEAMKENIYVCDICDACGAVIHRENNNGN